MGVDLCTQDVLTVLASAYLISWHSLAVGSSLTAWKLVCDRRNLVCWLSGVRSSVSPCCHLVLDGHSLTGSWPWPCAVFCLV